MSAGNKKEPKLKWVTFQFTDNLKSIVIDQTSTDDDYEKFREALVNSKSKNGVGARWAVVDVPYDLGAGEGKRNRVVFVAWCPENVNPVVCCSSY